MHRLKSCSHVLFLGPSLLGSLHPTIQWSLFSVQNPYKTLRWTDVQFLCRARGRNDINPILPYRRHTFALMARIIRQLEGPRSASWVA